MCTQAFHKGENTMRRLQKRNSGQGLIEYALIVSLVAITLLVILTTLGETASGGLLGNVQTAVETVEAKMSK